jgi:hypothetical protein
MGRHIKLYRTKNLFIGTLEPHDAAKDTDDIWGDIMRLNIMQNNSE